MESKRLLLATVLSVVVVVLYQFWMARYAPGPKPARPVAAASPAAERTPGSPAAAPAAAGQAAAPTPPAPAAAPAGSIVTVRTERYEARFSSAGGALVEARLLDYRASRDAGAPAVAVAAVPTGAIVPGLAVGAAGQSPVALPPDTLFRVEPAGGLEVPPGQQGTLTFTAEAPGGVRITNRYRFGGDRYAFRLEQTVVNGGKAPLAVQPIWTLRHARDVAGEAASGHTAGAIVRRGRDVRRIDFGGVEGVERINGPIDWAGWQDKYFAGVALPKGPALEAVVVSQQPAAAIASPVESRSGVASAQAAETGGPGPIGQLELLFAGGAVQPGGTLGAQSEVYLGPKDVGALRTVDPTLEAVLHFGMFHWVAMPLLLVLRWLEEILRNYGLAIIALTILIKLLFWPLTQKQIRSSKQMAKVQPLITQIREKYKDDRDAMNREMMRLFKEHNVNPLMGCLPLLVQIPVFFALYQVLNGSIELRQAPFFAWIQDLSAKDPYYITPVLMGVTMFVTQKLTPTPGMDPTQQKIMLFMPLMMTVFFLSMPAGLVLYWLVMNVLQILQQVWMNRQATA